MHHQSSEALITLSRVPQEFKNWLPRRRKRQLPSFSWLCRMARYGAHGVRLRTVYVGGTQCVTETDLRNFFAEMTKARRGDASVPTVPVSEGHRKAEQELAAAGL